MKILLVDDEEELVSTLAERLSFRGIEADWATSAEDALKLSETETYDIALLDVKMPRISGLELKKKLEEKKPDMQFIFLTGHGSEEDFMRGIAESGVSCYLAKPINIETLVEKLKEILGKE